MKSRIAIFSFYDKEGITDDYVTYLLDELLTVADRLIVMVNGVIDNESLHKLQKRTKEVIVRENIGYDAGAYKDALTNVIGKNVLAQYDELIFCNDTFYGPFLPLKTIWEKMGEKNCDFWGLNYLDCELFPHIDSYFMVFKQSVLKTGVLYDYFCNVINFKTNDLDEVIALFEDGLTMYLLDKGFKPVAYAERNKLSVYECSYLLMTEYNFPIIKKKCFSPRFNVQLGCMKQAVDYVKKNTCYNIELILKNAWRIYGITIDNINRQYKGTNQYREYRCNTDLTRSELKRFITEKKNIYIYGTGFWGKRIFHLYLCGKKNFKGFVVSDNIEETTGVLYGYPVSKISEICKESSLIIAMTRENTNEAETNAKGFAEVVKFWKD